MEWPNFQVTSTNTFTEYKFIGGGWLPVAMCYALLAAILIPYVIVVGRGTLDPFLPFVSQTAASPPQSGIFCIFLVISAVFALVGLHCLHMGVRIQKKRLDDPKIRNRATKLNKYSLIPGHLGIAGMVLVGAFPIDFYRPTEQWLIVTIFPHVSGATMVFLGGIFYSFQITYLMSLLHPEQKQLLKTRIILLCIISMSSVIQTCTVKDGFMAEFETRLVLKDCIVTADDIKYNLSYRISAVCEWTMLTSFIFFFMTLKEEAKEFCFTMTLSLREDSNKTSNETCKATKQDVNHNMGTSGEGKVVDSDVAKKGAGDHEEEICTPAKS